ncbi:MAG: NAD-dependent succinate-semialdehyde dehydrogenase [Gemmatimonadetes bacterium]|nr:NAD-dependent succinate-semialdehyde dehydrogenase [Gemmatimonadota bacterium]
MPQHSVNPATGDVLAVIADHSESECELRVAQAATTAATWRETPLRERTEVLRRVADRLDAEREGLARLATLEMGKTVEAARQEVAKCALACRYYADEAAAMLAPERVVRDGREDGAVHFLPLGVLLAIMPWNFPYWQAMRAAAPAVAAGNVVLLKHASNVPQCALAIERLFREAGAPVGVFGTLLISGARAGALIDDARIAAVTLTGSEAAGRDVGARAGRAIKPCVLELGGSDPFVVLPSADFVAAADTAARARCINNGQSCIAAKRFIVHTDVYDAFAERFVAAMRALRIGDPLRDDTDVGPLATAAIRDEVHDQVVRSVAAGARVLCGGEVPPGAGHFYPPTVLADVPHNAAASREEVFGPVAPLFRVASADEALALANDTPFGLGAAVWTRDAAEAERFGRDIEAGSVFINAMMASDPRFPFGGVKASGIGRELAREGLRSFVNVKTVRGAP